MFLPDENGDGSSGLVQVLIRIPDLLAATRLQSIVDGGYAPELWRIGPTTGARGFRALAPCVDQAVEIFRSASRTDSGCSASRER